MLEKDSYETHQEREKSIYFKRIYQLSKVNGDGKVEQKLPTYSNKKLQIVTEEVIDEFDKTTKSYVLLFCE